MTRSFWLLEGAPLRRWAWVAFMLAGIAAPTFGVDETLRLELLKVNDPAVGGDEAFRMLIPAGWKTEGGVRWMHDRSNLATVAMRIYNPNGVEALELLPLTPFTWTEGGVPFFPVGSIYLGNEVLPPVRDAAEFVRQIVLPRNRGGVEGLRVTQTAALPDVVAAVREGVQEPGVNKRVDAARVRVEYQERGRAIEEDIYCVVVYANAAMLPNTTFWGPERMGAFRAEKGKLDRLAGLLQAMTSSVRLNMGWFNKYQQVVHLWQQNQMQAIRNAGELSRYISRTHDEISTMMRESYENRQRSQDRINERFSRYVRGVETYDDSFEGRPVELPSGYNEAWVSGQGEYILSNNPNLNPNVGSTTEWRRMKQHD
jgi:hypothetical protein